MSSGEPTNSDSNLPSVTRSLADLGVEMWAIHGDGSTSNYLNEVVTRPSYLLSALDEDRVEDNIDFQKNFVMSVCACK